MVGHAAHQHGLGVKRGQQVIHALGTDGPIGHKTGQQHLLRVVAFQLTGHDVVVGPGLKRLLVQAAWQFGEEQVGLRRRSDWQVPGRQKTP